MTCAKSNSWEDFTSRVKSYHVISQYYIGKTLSEVKGHQSSFSTSSKGIPTVESYIIMAGL